MSLYRKRQNSGIAILKAFLVYLLLLLFCFPFSTGSAQSEYDNQLIINSSERIAQSFTSLYRGFNNFGLYILPEKQVEGSLVLKVFENSNPRELVFQEEYPINISKKEYLSLDFSPLVGSDLQDYFLELTWTGNKPLAFQTQNAKAYDQGSLYVNDLPVQAQLDFDLNYDKTQLVIGLAETGFAWVWKLLLTSLLLITPGWALLSTLWKRWSSYDTLTKLALSSGFSVALYPLLFLASSFLGFQPGETGFVWLVLVASILLLIVRQRRALVAMRSNNFSKSIDLWKGFKGCLRSSWVIIVILLVIVFTKLWVIRAVEIPLWGDSYQHTVITQLIMEQGGLFDSWQPYAEYRTFTVHFGFHSLATVYAWISNSSASQAVVWMGQILNILSALTIFPIAKRIANQNKWAGILAVIFAALIFKYPHFYVNWGRYAQLSGLVVLPVAAFLLNDGLFSKESGYKDLLIIPVVLGGMTMLYFRMPFFFVLLWSPLFVFEFVKWAKSPQFNLAVFIKKFAISIIGPGLIGVFLYLRISGGVLAENANSGLTVSIQTALSVVNNNLKLIKNYYETFYLLLIVLSIILSLLKKNWKPLLLAIGFLLLHFFYFGTAIGFPFASYMDGFSIHIMSFVPFSILCGYLLGELFLNLEKINRYSPQLLLILIVLVSAYFAKNVTDKAKHEVANWADLRAFEWIKENTEPDSLFLVNGFNIYSDTSSVGSDGGWWIPLLTGRRNTMPPQYALLNEKPIVPGYSQLIPEIIVWLENNNPDSPEGIDALCEWGIDYVYIGQKQGGVNDATPLLKWQDWEDSEILTPVYLQDQVRIYQFDISRCDAGK